MMTTVAALFGTLPIALGYGEGADARQPLGLAVVGGLVVSQFLTLYITPVIYLYLERLQERLRGAKARRLSHRANSSSVSAAPTPYAADMEPTRGYNSDGHGRRSSNPRGNRGRRRDFGR